MALDDHTRNLELCTYCPKLCRHACPIANAERREAVIPQAMMAMANLVRKGQVELTSEVASVFYHCMGCGLCGEVCEHDVDVTAALFDARALAAEQGAELPAMKGFVDRFVARNRRLQEALHKQLEERLFVTSERWGDEPPELVLFPGCDLIEHNPEGLTSTLRVLRAAGVARVGVDGGEAVCAGYPLWAAGKTNALRRHARDVAKQLEGRSQVISDCAQCVYTMREVYPDLGARIDAEVMHVTEFLATRSGKLRIRKVGGAAIYHDPCYLGRWLGATEAPRKLLEQAVVAVREFSWNRQRTYCCGGTGLVPENVPGAAEAIARERLTEAESGDARTVVTSQATCLRALRSQARGVEVLDLMTVLARAL